MSRIRNHQCYPPPVRKPERKKKKLGFSNTVLLRTYSTCDMSSGTAIAQLDGMRGARPSPEVLAPDRVLAAAAAGLHGKARAEPAAIGLVPSLQCAAHGTAAALGARKLGATLR